MSLSSANDYTKPEDHGTYEYLSEKFATFAYAIGRRDALREIPFNETRDMLAGQPGFVSGQYARGYKSIVDHRAEVTG